MSGQKKASCWVWDQWNSEFTRYDIKDTEDEPESVASIQVPRRKPFKRVLWYINRIVPDEELARLSDAGGPSLGRKAAPTVEAAKKAVDNRLRAEGWELEAEDE